MRNILTSLFSLFMVPAFTHAAIVAYWSFDDDFNADAGGSSYDLTASGSPTIQSGQTALGGGAAQFDRANSEYLFTSGDVVVPGQQDFSYSAWYYLDISNIIGSSRYFVLEATAGDSVSSLQSHPISYGLRDLGSGDVGETYTSEFNSSAVNFDFSTTPNQTWHNIITTFDADTGTIVSYLDGVQVGSGSGINNMDPGGGLVIGGHRAGTGRNFDGYIDEVAVYDSTLNATQIAALQTQTPAEVFGLGGSLSAVPEPGSLLLVALGSLGLFAVRRGTPTA